MAVTYLSRSDWGGGPVAAGYAVPTSQFVGEVVHHTVMVLPDYDRDGYARGDLDDIKRYMRTLKTARPDLGPDVPYSFVVFPGTRPDDAIVAEGRGLGRTGAHTAGYNSTRYGVAYAGNASTDAVTPGVLDGYRYVGRLLDDPANARPTIGHRDTKSTECPGNNLYARLGDIQPPFAIVTPEDLTIMDDATRKYLDARFGALEAKVDRLTTVELKANKTIRTRLRELLARP